MATKKVIKKEKKKEVKKEVKEEKFDGFDPSLPENKQRWLRK